MLPRAIFGLLLVTCLACSTSAGDIPASGPIASPKFDAFGDPLPPGALARFGTTRLRHDAKAVAFVDNNMIMSVGSSIRYWDAATGRLIREIRNPKLADPIAAAISANFKRAATFHGKEVIRIWETSSARLIREFKYCPRPDKSERLYPTISLSADGSRFVVSDRLPQGVEGRVTMPTCVYSVELATDPIELHTGDRDVTTSSISPDGRFVVTGVGTDRDDLITNQLLTLWDAASGKPLRNDSPGVGWITRVEFVQDGAAIAIEGRKGLALRTTAGREFWRHTSESSCVDFACAMTDRVLVWVAKDGSWRTFEMRVLETKSGKVLQSWDYLTWPGLTAAASPDGKKLAIVECDRLQLLNLADGTELVSPQGHLSSIHLTCVTPDGRFIASSSSEENDIILWNVIEGREVRRFKGHKARCRKIVLSSDGHLLASSSDDKSVRVWEIATGRQLRIYSKDDQNVKCISFITNTRRLAIVGRGASEAGLDLFDYSSGKVIESRKISESIWGLTRHPDGRLLLILASSQLNDHDQHVVSHVEVSDLLSGRTIRQIGDCAGYDTYSVLSPDGRTLTTSGEDGSIRLWELATGRQRLCLKEQSVAERGWNWWQTHAFSPDGLMIASSGSDIGRIYLWDLASCRLSGTFRGQDGRLTTIDYTSDGRRLLTGSGDTTILSWDMTRPEWRSRPIKSNLSEQDLVTHWDRLRNSTAEEAYRCKWAFVGDPKKTVAFFWERLRPEPLIAAGRIQSWLVDLDSPRYAVRERAHRELLSHFDQTENELRKCLTESISVEKRNRINRIIDASFAAIPEPDQLRDLRAIEVLEQIGTPEAREVLQSIAKSDVPTRISRDAAESLKRLEARPR
jgi:WD40 repeat protein